MAHKGCQTITLPDSLLEEVKKIVESDTLGYKPKSEFIKESIRQRIIDHRKTELLKK